MGRKRSKKKVIHPKEKRLSVPFQEMSDNDIVRYFLTSNSFLRNYVNFTKRDYDSCLEDLTEALTYVQKEDFVQFIKTCHEAFKSKSEDRRRFFNYIISYLQDETKLLSQSKIEKELSSTKILEQVQWLPWKISLYPKVNNFLFDFATDFYDNAGETELRKKYKLNRQNYIKYLNKMKEEGIIPLPLSM